MIMMYYWDKKLIKVLDADIIILKKNINLMSLIHWMLFFFFFFLPFFFFFLQDVFQKNATALVSVINHYHINGLHLFWDTLYMSSFEEMWSTPPLPLLPGLLWPRIVAPVSVPSHLLYMKTFNYAQTND